jgi:tRNA A-37 threonylcarbamoyl transferase component Bud32
MECPSCHKPVDGSERFCKNCGSPVPTVSIPGTDPLLGQILGGKFRVVKLLGEGGMGAVYEGEQQLGTKARKVAIKTLHKELSSDPSIQARFQREVSTIAELEHPNTIQVYDFGSTPEGQLYLVMEFVQGKSLATVLETSGAMDPVRADAILRQICGSLGEAHTHGIVHRDMKPDNVVLTERAGQKEFVKVLDFGIAQVDENAQKEQKLTQAGMVLGTPPYMSPEQFIGKGLDLRSDIYSIAVMAYEMLTGKLPWSAESAGEWAIQHMTVMPYPIDQLPEGARIPVAMRNAIMKALAKTPDQRFANLKDFYEAFSSGGAMAGNTAVMGVAGAQPPFQGGMQAPFPSGNQAQFHTAPAVAAVTGGARSGTEAAPAFAPSFDPGPLPAPMPLPPPSPMYASAPQSGGGGGGGGKAIAIVLLVVLMLGGGGAAAFFLLGHNATASNATDSGVATTIVPDASPKSTAASTDTGSPLEPLIPDAGKEPASHPYVPSTTAHPTSTTTNGIPAPPQPPTPPGLVRCPIPACREAATARAQGRTRQANALASECRAAGCVAQ